MPGPMVATKVTIGLRRSWLWRCPTHLARGAATGIGRSGNQEGSMKTKAAVLRGTGTDFEITELELDPPKAGEVLIRYVAAGL